MALKAKALFDQAQKIHPSEYKNFFNLGIYSFKAISFLKLLIKIDKQFNGFENLYPKSIYRKLI